MKKLGAVLLILMALLISASGCETIKEELSSTPAPGSLAVEFIGWYVDGSKIEVTQEGKTVKAVITISGGDAGTYKMRINKDIMLEFDEIVNSLEFQYDGVSKTVELSFSAYARDDEHTVNGFHVDLLHMGTVWTLEDSYPPRLRVQ